jgi:hypothetical protein
MSGNIQDGSEPVVAGRTERIERRTLRRVSVLEGLGLVILAKVGPGGGLILELGENGVSIQLAGPMPPLAEWEVEFELDCGATPVKAKAQTIWRKDGVLGVRFVDLATDCRNQLSRWLYDKHARLTLEASSLGQPVALGPSRLSSSILGLDSEAVRGQPFQREPSIAGPSFLGIGAEPERQPNKYSYLFEYDEPRSHRGLWITLVLLVAAALVGLQFRAALRARALPLYAAVLARVNPQPPAPPTPAATLVPADSTAAAGGNDALPGTGVTPDVGPQSAVPPASQPKPEDNAATAANLDEKSDTAERARSDDATDNPAPTKAARQPHKAFYTSRRRPAPPAVVAPEDNRLLQLAQKYIHGQGVRPDCDRGIIYLREAMRQPSAAAASQMGALYATGTCVSLDRVAAYLWFSSALQMTPSNPWLARERDQLYAQMSSAERRQADRQ